MKSNKQYDIGEKLTIEMLRSNDGKRPIGKVDRGMICLIDFKDKTFLKYGSVWECEIVQVKEKCLIVKPVKMLVSAEQNETEAAIMAKRAFSKPERKKIRKGPTNYQYKRSDER